MSVDVTAVPTTILEAAVLCRTRVEECLTIESLMQHEWAENRLADFNLWATGLGVFASQRVSLDRRLSDQPEALAIVTI
jgi:hypothetical protein